MGKTLYWIEKAIYLTISFVAVILVLGFLKVWGLEQNTYFSFVGDIESLIVIAVVVTGATIVLEKLWKWEIHQIFKPRKSRRRRRR